METRMHVVLLKMQTMNTRFEAIEKKRDAKCDSKEVKEIVRQEMDALHT